ncbi:aldo/keto reductase [Rhizosphaericola mali]|uniref:Aldo/keto reductase n=1 Tax=Rhizosphaericola mali TaxID=2545455 RepID=A0A5P2G8K2_9BACT|nr:aldo/keto reductase [Rhizosphaericola mali]QES89543.1 aldo/keto reductase [Rhizosphaericola mali]
MEYNTLGKSNIKISEIGFGCMSLKNIESENINIIHSAIDQGINYFDTADMYDKGDNEILVGKAVKEKRKEIILATKVGNQWRADVTGWDWNPTKEYILKEIDNSLQRLQTDYIDLYQLHGGTLEDNIDETIEAFEILKEKGKILEYGISSIRPNVIREYVQKSHIVSVMMQYSLLDRRPEEAMLGLLKENNISVLSRGTLASGLLVDKPAKAYLDHTEKGIKDFQNLIHKQTNGKDTATAVAISFVLSAPALASAAIGIRTQAQLDSILHAYSIRNEFKQLAKELADHLYPLKYSQHR